MWQLIVCVSTQMILALQWFAFTYTWTFDCVLTHNIVVETAQLEIYSTGTFLPYWTLQNMNVKLKSLTWTPKPMVSKRGLLLWSLRSPDMNPPRQWLRSPDMNIPQHWVWSPDSNLVTILYVFYNWHTNLPYEFWTGIWL